MTKTDQPSYLPKHAVDPQMIPIWLRSTKNLDLLTQTNLGLTLPTRFKQETQNSGETSSKKFNLLLPCRGFRAKRQGSGPSLTP